MDSLGHRLRSRLRSNTTALVYNKTRRNNHIRISRQSKSQEKHHLKHSKQLRQVLVKSIPTNRQFFQKAFNISSSSAKGSISTTNTKANESILIANSTNAHLDEEPVRDIDTDPQGIVSIRTSEQIFIENMTSLKTVPTQKELERIKQLETLAAEAENNNNIPQEPENPNVNTNIQTNKLKSTIGLNPAVRNLVKNQQKINHFDTNDTFTHANKIAPQQVQMSKFTKTAMLRSNTAKDSVVEVSISTPRKQVVSRQNSTIVSTNDVANYRRHSQLAQSIQSNIHLEQQSKPQPKPRKLFEKERPVCSGKPPSKIQSL